MQTDRGFRVGTSSGAARDASDKALWRMMSFYDTPLADLDAATEADPAWALPHVMKAGFLLSLTEPSLVDEAAAALAHAQSLGSAAPSRERAHLAAVNCVLEGRWQAACDLWGELLIEHPRDALALQWAHLWDFYRGDTHHLRARPARALPDWSADDPLRPCVLGLYAFGLEENNLYPQAEEVGRQALQDDPRVPWAVHAVAHVMEMQGRFDEGAAWLRQHQPAWADGNGFSVHLWWHKALFRIEAMDIPGALRLLDNHMSGDALQVTLNRVDTASLLWRLHLLGADVQSRCAALADGWDLDPAHAGHYAFNDLHAVLMLLAAGDLPRAEGWIARCAERAMAAEDGRRSNHRMARDIGLPLMRGMLALSRGQAEAATALLQPVRAGAHRFGGSHAQRDLIDQTLLCAVARSGQRDLGRALLNERLMAKPATPLTRHWIEQVGVPLEIRA